MTRWEAVSTVLRAGARRSALALLASPAAWAAGPAEPLPAAWPDCVVKHAPQACADARETAALAQAGERAAREGSSLVLRMGGEGSPPLRLSDEASRHWRLLGLLEGSDAWVVAELVSEQPTRFLLVSPGNAQGLRLAEWPWVAPTGRQILVVDSPEGGHTQGSVTLLQKAGPRWSQIFRYEPPMSINFYFRSWRADGAAVRLEWARLAAGCPAGEAMQGALQLRDGPYGWDFVPEPPGACAAPR